MVPLPSPCQRGWFRLIRLGIFAAVIAGSPALVAARQASKDEVLRIGTSGTLSAEKDGKDKGSLETLQSFIKEETGLSNDIVRQKDWRELADKMSKGQLKVGVFQGFEFAWAVEQHPDLKPLALAVNVTRYPVAYVVTRRADPAKDFAGLQGQSFYLPDASQRFLRLFVQRECQAKGKDIKSFFSKITPERNVEDCLDDVVDGTVEAMAVDRAALEAYKQRKPGRFAQLKEVAKSEPFPPVVIAYYDKQLDEKTLQRFRDGLLSANKKEKGRTLLTLFRLTNFEGVPADFSKVLAETRKTYPPPKAATK